VIRFRIRTLFVCLFLISVCCALVRRETVGYLKMYPPAPRPKSVFTLGHHPKLRFVCASNVLAAELASQLDPETIRDDAIDKILVVQPGAASALEAVEFGYVSSWGNTVSFKYQTGGWYRRRFSLSDFRYKKDRKCPEAMVFNDAVSLALDQAAKEFAASREKVALSNPIATSWYSFR